MLVDSGEVEGRMQVCFFNLIRDCHSMNLNPVFTTSWSMAAAIALSNLLRAGTASVHEQFECLLELPLPIRDRKDYDLSLGRLPSIDGPPKRSLAAFREWHAPFCAVAPRRQ
jgi:hypothetical protein